MSVEPLTHKNYNHARAVDSWHEHCATFKEFKNETVTPAQKFAMLSRIRNAAQLTRNMMIYNAQNLDPLKRHQVHEHLQEMAEYARMMFSDLDACCTLDGPADNPEQILVPVAASALAECTLTMHEIRGGAIERVKIREELSGILRTLERSEKIGSMSIRTGGTTELRDEAARARAVTQSVMDTLSTYLGKPTSVDRPVTDDSLMQRMKTLNSGNLRTVATPVKLVKASTSRKLTA